MSVHTQQGRVLAALRAHPNDGVTQVDFELPNVIDGGKPILRLAARIEELKRERDIPIEVVGKRNRCNIYRLTDVERGGGRAPACQPVPVAPLSADSIPRRWFCNHTRACMGKPLDGPVCPRGADHPTYTAHHVDLLPAPVADRLAA